MKSSSRSRRRPKGLVAVLVFAISSVMSSALVVPPVRAATVPAGTTINGLRFRETAGVIEFVGFPETNQNNWPELLIIPDKIMWGGNLREVKKIGWSPYHNADATISAKPSKVKIGRYVNSIGDWGLGNLSALSGVTFPAGVTTLGAQAFRYGALLNQRYLGDRPTSIATDVFNGTSGTKNIHYQTGTTGWPGGQPLIGNKTWVPATNSQLSLLDISIAGAVLELGFKPSELNYSFGVSASTSSVTVSPLLADTNAAVTINGISAKSGPIATQGAGFNAVTLVTGTNVISVEVTAEDQSTTSTYVISVIRNAKVTYNANGGVGAMSAQEAGSPTNLTSNTSTRSGYTFAGWNTAANGSGQSYLDGGSFPFTSNATLYAQWTANSLSVSFDSGQGSSVLAGSTVTGGSVASPGSPTRAGYQFVGWFAALTGGSPIVFPYTHAQTADFTLFARWSLDSYVVSFFGNGATEGSVPDAQNKTHGVDLTLQSNSGSLVKAGYTFAGWNTATDGGGTSYPVGATYGVDSAVSLYAQWTANSLSVSFDSREGSSVLAGSTVTGGSVASPGLPTRTGYQFVGWFAALTGGSPIVFPYTHGQTADFTLFARWSQSSLHGLKSIEKIGTITTTAGVGNTFAADTESSYVSLRYPANGLPANTVIDVYLVNDLTRAKSLISPAGGFVVSLVVAWLAPDGSIPPMASGKPLLMTIANATIKADAKSYAIIGDTVTLIGTAVVDGTITIEITEDPEVVVVNPVAVTQAPNGAVPQTPTASAPTPVVAATPTPVVAATPTPVVAATPVVVAMAKTIAVKTGRTSSLTSLAKTTRMAVPKGAKVSGTVAKASMAICKVAGAKIIGVTPGKCTVTIKVTPKKGKATTKSMSMNIVGSPTLKRGASITLINAAAAAGLTTGSGVSVEATVAASSSKLCKVSGAKIVAAKAGRCSVSVTVMSSSDSSSTKSLTIKVV